MRLADVITVVERFENPQPPGFRVDFERRRGGFLEGDFFPAICEPPFTTEAEAWLWAWRFARANRGIVVNVYVINEDFTPVKNYKDKMINHLIPDDTKEEHGH